MRGLLLTFLVASHAAVAAGDEFSVGMRRELLSAVLCIDLDVQIEAKGAIKREHDNARGSGGGVVDLQAIHDAQDDWARAGREAAKVRKQLSALKVKPQKCGDVARTYNCINNRADQLPSSIDGEHCDIQQFGRFRELIESLRLDEPETVESTRLYTFKK